MRHKKAPKRNIAPDRLYGSLLVAKFINRLMKDGKKTVAEKVVYDAFAILSQKGHNPLELFEKALATIAPKVEIKARRVGGANYQVPVEVRGERKNALSIRWLLVAATGKSNKDFHSTAAKLAAEIELAAQGQGDAMKKREVMHKQAEANRAFSHFRF